MAHPASVRVPDAACPMCHKVLDAAVSVTLEKIQPRPGDISVCAYCHCVNVFEEGGTLRPATLEEAKEALVILAQMRTSARRN